MDIFGNPKSLKISEDFPHLLRMLLHTLLYTERSLEERRYLVVIERHQPTGSGESLAMEMTPLGQHELVLYAFGDFL